jgi:hypothetical protein
LPYPKPPQLTIPVSHIMDGCRTSAQPRRGERGLNECLMPLREILVAHCSTKGVRSEAS